jgi:hypothetical protein
MKASRLNGQSLSVQKKLAEIERLRAELRGLIADKTV